MPDNRILMASHASDQSGTALSTSYASLNLGAKPNGSNPTQAYVAVPENLLLDHLEVQFASLSGSPTTATMFLSWDSSGDYAATNEASATIKAGKTTATKGTATWVLNRIMARPPGIGTAGTLYVWVKLDTGTANGVVRGYGRA
jgi:hypothetical protein